MKLLFNGCSFTAGDLVTWHLHYPDIDSQQHIWEGKPHARYSRAEIMTRAQIYTQQLRSQNNLSAVTASLTGLPVVDLAVDGASNQSIAQGTIDWITRNPDEYCVCIGWTEPARRLIWDGGNWVTLSVARLQDRNLPPQWRRYIDTAIVAINDATHQLDYYNSALLLYSWLTSRNIPVVFWRSMGTAFTLPLQGGPYSSPVSDPATQWRDRVWLDSFNGVSWQGRLTPADWINSKNSHPNRAAVGRQAELIAARVLERV
jgi:hypothetical protein